MDPRTDIWAAREEPKVDLPAVVLDAAGVPSGGVIADIGCGNGAYLAELAKRAVASRVIGMDLSPGMLAAASARSIGTAALVNADATALPLRPASVDLTLAMHMLYHVPDPLDAVRELRRVTRPGGTVVISLNGADHQEVPSRPQVTATGPGAESALTHSHPARRLPAETAPGSTITQIYEGTNQVQRTVIARQLLK